MSVGVGLCRNVGRSDVFVVEFFSCLFEESPFLSDDSLFLFENSPLLSSQTHSFFTKQHSLPPTNTTGYRFGLGRSNRRNMNRRRLDKTVLGHRSRRIHLAHHYLLRNDRILRSRLESLLVGNAVSAVGLPANARRQHSASTAPTRHVPPIPSPAAGETHNKQNRDDHRHDQLRVLRHIIPDLSPQRGRRRRLDVRPVPPRVRARIVVSENGVTLHYT